MKRHLVWLLLIPILISGCGARLAAGDFTDLDPVWRSYEVHVYELKLSDNTRGQVTYSIQKQQQDNRSVFQIDYTADALKSRSLSGVVMDAETFEPVSSYYQQMSPDGEEERQLVVSAVYEPARLHLNHIKGEKKSDLIIPVPHYVLDNEALLMMIRNFPLTEGFEKSLNVALISTTEVAPYAVEVLGRESIALDSSEVMCYKVVIKFTGRGAVPHMTAWYSTDEDHTLIKFENRNLTFILTESSYEP